jgi:hypothetical protein
LLGKFDATCDEREVSGLGEDEKRPYSPAKKHMPKTRRRLLRMEPRSED